MQPYPPLGTLYAAAVLRDAGYTVTLLDTNFATPITDWEHLLGRVRPRFAVIYEDHFNYLSKMCLLRTREAALAMIRAARQHPCTVIISSADATDHPELYLRAGAHFVIIGEGEYTLRDLLHALTGRTDQPVATIPGLAHADPGSDRVVHTGPRPVIRDLDALPFPARDLVDMDRYRDLWTRHHGYFSLNLVTTRGCPYHCNWCAKPIWGQTYNVRSPENVVAEMRVLKAHYDPDHLWFMDDIMGLQPGWLARFADLVNRYRVRIPFKCLHRADLLLRPGEIDALHRAGCAIVWIGAESGSQRVLDAMEKGIRVEQIHTATRALHAHGIRVGLFIQFGYPGETWEDIRATLRLIRTCRPDDIGISVSYPLPGTKFYDRVRDQLGSRQHWIDSGDLAMLYRGPFPTAFYRQLYRVVHREFRIRCAVRTWRTPWRWTRRDLRRWGRALGYLLAWPWDRGRLWMLRHRPHRGIGPLPVELSPDEAATPAPVNFHPSRHSD